jgi:hypothetical protein
MVSASTAEEIVRPEDRPAEDRTPPLPKGFTGAEAGET